MAARRGKPAKAVLAARARISRVLICSAQNRGLPSPNTRMPICASTVRSGLGQAKACATSVFALEHDVIVSGVKGWEQGSGLQVSSGIHHTLSEDTAGRPRGRISNAEEVGGGDRDAITAVVNGGAFCTSSHRSCDVQVNARNTRHFL